MGPLIDRDSGHKRGGKKKTSHLWTIKRFLYHILFGAYPKHGFCNLTNEFIKYV